MKKVLSICILILPFISKAQSKLSYELMLNVSGVSNSSAKPESASRTFDNIYIRDSAGSPIQINNSWGGIYTAAKEKPLKHKAKLTSSITIGGKLSYQLYKEFSLSIGASITLLKASRIEKDNNTGPYFSNGYFTGINTLTGALVVIAPGFYNSIKSPDKEQNYKFTTINIPLAISYTKAKWQFEGGIIPSFIISSTKEKYEVQNTPEITYAQEPDFTNDLKTSFSLSISPSYQVAKNVKVGLEYVYGLSPGMIKAFDVYKLMPQSLGLKILYKIK